MATKLTLYNGALRELGERRLSSLTENAESRRVLDSVWDEGVVRGCLEAGMWTFALRTTRIDYSPSIEPDFGYSRAFDKPNDFVRTTQVCTDEFFTNPLTDYTDEAGYWFSDNDEIFVQYVSDDSSYGNDYSRWPQNFVTYVQLVMAEKAAMGITRNKQVRDDCIALSARALTRALSTDAMAKPTKFAPRGSWTVARMAGGGRRTRNEF